MMRIFENRVLSR